MGYTYTGKKRADKPAEKTGTPAQEPSLEALRTGAAKPTSEQMGRRVDLPDAMRSKMENAFGADLSAVKLYESETVADAGAGAIAQGSNIAFAPGMLDFSSFGGQALLGHEISHVVSQQRGEVTGGGFLNDHALEARADREGAMAAAGQTVAMPSAAMSSASAAPSVGPMQAGLKRETAGRKPTWNERRLDHHDAKLRAYKGQDLGLSMQLYGLAGEEARAPLLAQQAKLAKKIKHEEAKVAKYQKKTAGLGPNYYLSSDGK